jgi:signal transduction histidine kinase
MPGPTLIPRLAPLRQNLIEAFLSVPVRIKISGIIALPVVMLGIGLNYWIRTGLSDWLSYILDDQRVELAMSVGSRSVLLVTGLVTVLALLLALLLTLFLTKPLIELSNVAKDVAGGNIQSRARVWSQDEIGELALSVNGMIDLLLTNQLELERTNKRLEAINHVATTIGNKVELQAVLDTALSATLDVMDLQTGWICLVDREHCQAGSGYSMTVSRGGPGLADRITSGTGSCHCNQTHISENVENFIAVYECSEAFEQNQPINHISIPLMLGIENYGILNLICNPDFELSSDDREMLDTIGTQISESVTNARLLQDLLDKERARQSLLQALVQAQENERANLSRRLHDDAGQVLTSLLIRLKVLQKQAPSVEFSKEIGGMCQAFSETIENIRGISHRLRPASLEEFGVEVAIRALTRDMLEASGIAVEQAYKLSGNKLPFEIETCLFRIAQESLTNIIRHAKATAVEIDLAESADSVLFKIHDNGKGFDPQSLPKGFQHNHLGLSGIKERVDILDGKMTLIASPQQGTTIEIIIPVIREVM